MKIWITFDTVGSLQSGGLERCRVWWQKPYYQFIDRQFEYDSLPFGADQTQGLCSIGWRYYLTQGFETGSVSLGKIFKYEGDICNLVWEKLCEFFQSDDLRQWDIKADELKLDPKDFLLELDVNFALSK
jgi:hypothetical protein|tara:strand:- start:33037 stop:33423 length:387 start_codon:yes stop_codon:yes gene_type:complete